MSLKENLELETIPGENEILENATKTFFPQTGRWYSTCFGRPNEYNILNLPCHLRDARWLAKMLQIEKKLTYINFNNILHFVKTSPFFAEQRHAYEQRIVRWQIWFMMSPFSENWCIDEKYGGDELNQHPKCDIGFRKAIVDTLTAIGMNKQAIEEGIEKNADLWREQYMNRAFSNRFYEGCLFYEYDSIDKEHEEIWLKMRRYQYYQRHKKSIDMYGTVHPDMKISYEKATKLYMYLIHKNAERIRHMKECKSNPAKRKTIKLY